jgi:hypothetical protein
MRKPEKNNSIIRNFQVYQIHFTDHRILGAYGENMKPTNAKSGKEF